MYSDPVGGGEVMPLYRVTMTREVTVYVRADTPPAAAIWAERHSDEIEEQDTMPPWGAVADALPVQAGAALRDGWSPDCGAYGDHTDYITCAEAIEETNNHPLPHEGAS